MTGSRTGTAKWARVRKQALALAIGAVLTNCPMPGCGQPLDYMYPKRPNSAEVDHIIPHAEGGTDTIENARVICRKCNGTTGGQLGNKRMRANQTARKTPTLAPQTTINW